MRILYIVSLFPCWSETFIVREIRELLRLGVDIRIVSLKHPMEKIVQSDARDLLDRVIYPPSGARNQLGTLWNLLCHMPLVTGMALDIAGSLARHPLSLLKSLAVLWRALSVIPAIRALAPAHMHAHWATYPSTAALFLSRSLGIPYSFTAHAHDIFLEHHLLTKKLLSARYTITISRHNATFLQGMLPRPDDSARIRIVHCGVVLAEYPYHRQGRDRGSILAVGRLDEIKGFPCLIEACGILAQQGCEFRCDIIGDGPLRDTLSRLISDCKLADRVRLLGVQKQEQVRELMDKATVFALPCMRTARGDMDGIPVAIIEAMAAGAPVLSTRLSGIPELIEHEVSGLLAEPDNSPQCAEYLARLLTEPELAEKLAHNARIRVESDFDAGREARKLHDLFRAAHG